MDLRTSNYAIEPSLDYCACYEGLYTVTCTLYCACTLSPVLCTVPVLHLHCVWPPGDASAPPWMDWLEPVYHPQGGEQGSREVGQQIYQGLCLVVCSLWVSVCVCVCIGVFNTNNWNILAMFNSCYWNKKKNVDLKKQTQLLLQI